MPTTQDYGETGTREYTGTLVRRAGRTRYEHDAQGRIVLRERVTLSGERRTWRFHWDADDRLTTVETPGGSHWRYHYDPLGRRITKHQYASDGTTRLQSYTYAWDGTRLAEQTHHVHTQDHTPRTTTWTYQPGTHTPLTQTERVPAATAPQEWIDQRFHAIITDLIGTPTELVDPNGEVTPTHTSAWGAPTTGHPSPCPLRFPGQYHDPETSLHYNFHRYYDPATAAYLSPDPLGLTPQPNPHAYVPNPTTWQDPLGLTPHNYGAGNPDKLKTGEQYLYRAVKEGELKQIKRTRRYENLHEGDPKYFSNSPEGAAAYAREMYGRFPNEGPYTLTRATIRTGLIGDDNEIKHLADAGGKVDAVTLWDDGLREMGRVRIVPFIPIS